MPYSLGQKTKNVFLYGPEVHKLHLEFAPEGEVHVGTPVKLTATGTVTPMTVTDAENLCIGVSIHDGYSAYGDLVVIAMRGYTVVEGAYKEVVGNTGLAIGPVNFNGWEAKAAASSQPAFGKGTRETGTTDVVGDNLFAAATTLAIGWNLTTVPIGTGTGTLSPIQVIIKD